MRPLDTDPKIWQLQMSLLKKAGASRRLEMALRLSEGVRGLARDGVRHRHPEYSEAEVEWAWRRTLLRDDTLFKKVWPEGPLLPT